MQSLTGLMADHLAPAKRAALRARPRIAILIPCLDEELTIGGVIEQFRKEIGKYVDKKEVARLERYVTLN